MTFDVDVEVVLPRPHPGWPRFKTRHRYAVLRQRRQHVIDGARPVRHRKDQRCLVAAGGAHILPAEHRETRAVLRIVLDMTRGHRKAVQARRVLAGDRGRGGIAGGDACCFGIAGDRYAFEELFYRHHRQLYRIARITSRNPDDAADALQDAMLKAHRRAPAFRYDSAVNSWLHRIVVNACLDRLRRNKIRAAAQGEMNARLEKERQLLAKRTEQALVELDKKRREALADVMVEAEQIAHETASKLLGRGV